MTDNTGSKVNVERPVYTMTCNSCDKSFHVIKITQSTSAKIGRKYLCLNGELKNTWIYIIWKSFIQLVIILIMTRSTHLKNLDASSCIQYLKFAILVHHVKKELCSFRHSTLKKDKVTNKETVQDSEEVENDEHLTLIWWHLLQ